MAKQGSFFVRLCYGYVGRYKDTSKMTTKEVIEEFLKRKGVSTPKEFFTRSFGKQKVGLNFFGNRNDKGSNPISTVNPVLPKEAFGFKNNDFLNTPHHTKHMKDMGFDNSKEYEKSAIEFWNKGEGEIFYSNTRKRLHKYNEKRGIMIVISPEGTIYTFYQVKSKKFKAIMLQERLEKWKK